MAYTYGTTITDVLNAWADLGVFAYMLPFLMIFAIVYGILTKTEILGRNKGVHATIALAVGLLALQFDYVSNFFALIFPYAGMGIAVLLVALILMGLISDRQTTWAKYIWFGIGIVIFIVVLLTALSDLAWLGGLGYGWVGAWPALLFLIIVLAVISLIIFPKWGRTVSNTISGASSSPGG